jgi:integrase
VKSDRSEDLWSKTIKSASVSIYAFERSDRAGIFLKYSSPSKVGRDRRVKVKLPGDLGVRDAKGRLNSKLIANVTRAVERYAAALLLGQLPQAPVQSKRLTLREGFQAALDIGSGKFATKSDRWAEVGRAQTKVERILGKEREWETLTPKDLRTIWRTLAKEYKAHHNEMVLPGARQTEVTVDGLLSVAAWLRKEELLPPNTIVPPKKWRAELADEWEKITGETVEPNRPRHTPDEMRRLFAHCADARVDPRLRLAFDLGGEQRLGQVLVSRRSQLVLPEDTARSGADDRAGQSGILYVRGNGKKKAAPVALTSDQLATVRATLAHGYLAEWEAQRVAGAVADYPLFPSERLLKGVSRPRENATPLGTDAARKMFRVLETIAGVESVPGRVFYGVRRVATDVAEDVEKDERVLNSLSGHRDSSTRRLIYQNRERPEILTRAAEVRAIIRGQRADEKPASAASSVPQIVPQHKTVEEARPRPLVQMPMLQQDNRERATGLEPATSSLGS